MKEIIQEIGLVFVSQLLIVGRDGSISWVGGGRVLANWLKRKAAHFVSLREGKMRWPVLSSWELGEDEEGELWQEALPPSSRLGELCRQSCCVDSDWTSRLLVKSRTCSPSMSPVPDWWCDTFMILWWSWWLFLIQPQEERSQLDRALLGFELCLKPWD